LIFRNVLKNKKKYKKAEILKGIKKRIKKINPFYKMGGGGV